MPITQPLKIEKKEIQEFKPLPENIYQVELLDISAEQKPTFDTRNKPDNEKKYETVLNFQFTLLAGVDNGEQLRGRNIWKNFVPTGLWISLKGKNALYQITEAIKGGQLSPEEEAFMDQNYLNSLIGKQCRVGVKNKQSGDKTYSNIEVFYPVESYMTALTAEERDKATVKKDVEVDTKNAAYDQRYAQEVIRQGVEAAMPTPQNYPVQPSNPQSHPNVPVTPQNTATPYPVAPQHVPYDQPIETSQINFN